MTEKRNIYLTLHKNFVKTDIEYVDKASGETRTFNSVTLPKGTVVNGMDVSYFQFSPLFVNPSKYRGASFVDIPLLADREVWLQRSVLDEDGVLVVNEDGKTMKDTVKVMPAHLKEAVEASRSEYLRNHQGGRSSNGLAARAENAREGSAALSKAAIPFDGRSSRGR